MDNGFKKYVVIEYDGLSEDIYFYFFETDVEKWSEEFNQILEDYEGNHSNLIVVDFDKFKDAIKKNFGIVGFDSKFLQNLAEEEQPKFETIKKGDIDE